MLSYQHLYHAGNLGDVHKHALLAWSLDYLTSKDKPLSYLETHAGRGLYALDVPEAQKTGEAAAGIARVEQAFAPDHPYMRVLQQIRATSGAHAYAGSPLIAAQLLRSTDSITLAELHPQEHAALTKAMAAYSAVIHKRDGLDMALALCPPTPRRGLLMIDPSYEVKADYERLPRAISALHAKWNVGVIVLWYPILKSCAHQEMIASLRATHDDLAVFETRFQPIRDGHRMIGSGLAVINAPWGMSEEAGRVDEVIRRIAG